MKNKSAEERRLKAEARARYNAAKKQLAMEERRKVPKWAQSAVNRRKQAPRRRSILRHREESDEEYESEDPMSGGALRSLSALAASPYAPYDAKEWALHAPGGGMTEHGYERDRRSSLGGDP